MTPFRGYPGLIWPASYQTVAWFGGQLASGSATPAVTEALAARHKAQAAAP